jgi:hypothetical protein
MAEETFLRGECEHCAGHIEFPSEAANRIIPCPHCNRPTRLTAGGNVPRADSPVERPTAAGTVTSPKPQETVAGRILSQTEWIGWGSLLQLIGVVLLFWFPIGTTLGVLLFVVGYVLSRKFVCSECGYIVLSRAAMVCPACGASFAPPARKNEMAWAVAGLAIVLGLIWLVHGYRRVSDQSRVVLSSDILEVRDLDFSDNGAGTSFIEGLLTNHSAETYLDVRVDFGLYDATKLQVGLISGYTDVLAGHGSWKFVVEAIATNLTEVKVVNISRRPAAADLSSTGR